MTFLSARRGALFALAFSLSACTSVDAQAPALVGALTPAEEAYVAQTAAVIYRRASVDRLPGLLFSDARGHGTCVRSPSGASETADYTLLILQRRITEDFISQAADDVLILRSASDAAPCRQLGNAAGLWVRAN